MAARIAVTSMSQPALALVASPVRGFEGRHRSAQAIRGLLPRWRRVQRVTRVPRNGRLMGQLGVRELTLIMIA